MRRALRAWKLLYYRVTLLKSNRQTSFLSGSFVRGDTHFSPRAYQSCLCWKSPFAEGCTASARSVNKSLGPRIRLPKSGRNFHAIDFERCLLCCCRPK